VPFILWCRTDTLFSWVLVQGSVTSLLVDHLHVIGLDVSLKLALGLELGKLQLVAGIKTEPGRSLLALKRDPVWKPS
jgi:hypothetical protein